MLIEINRNNIDNRLIKEVVTHLNKGELIIYPTDSVYSIGCDLKNKKALEKLAKFKDIKLKNSKFSVICHDLSQVSDYVKQMSQPTFKLMKRLLPGPFTFIMNATQEVTRLFDSKRTEIGIRIPSNPIIMAIVQELGNPIATTSLHDEEDEMLQYFIDPYEIYQRYDDKVEIIIDGGQGKIETTTIIDCTDTEPILIREGVGKL